MRTRQVVAVLAVLALLSACAQEPDTSAEGPGSIPSVSATPEPVEIVRPAAQYPGDCTGLFPDAAVDAALGMNMTEDGDEAFPETPLVRAVTEQAGTLTCNWNGTGGPNHIRIIGALTRHAELREGDSSVLEGQAGSIGGLGIGSSFINCYNDSVSFFNCHGGAIVGDYRIIIYADGVVGGVSGESLNASMAAMFTPVVQRLGSDPVPALWTPPETAWPTQYDCAALGARVDLSGAVGVPSLVVSDASGKVYDDHADSRPVAALGGSTICGWNNAATNPVEGALVAVTANIVAGGAWFWDAWSDYPDRTTEVVDVEGADDALIACRSGADECEVYARIGVNAVGVGGSVDFRYYPLTRERALSSAAAIIGGLAE